MNVKKDHSIGEGAGAVTGAVTGAAVGSAAGPVGTVVGALAGGVVGAKAEPAYKYGYDTYSQYRGQRFEDVEPDLERNWNTTRANSRLEWNDARGAVRDGWHHIERNLPGDFDRDGR